MNIFPIVIRAFRKVFANAKAISYFPEGERKPYLQRLADNLIYLFQYRSVNDFYLLYGFDLQELTPATGPRSPDHSGRCAPWPTPRRSA